MLLTQLPQPDGRSQAGGPTPDDHDIKFHGLSFHQTLHLLHYAGILCDPHPIVKPSSLNAPVSGFIYPARLFYTVRCPRNVAMEAL